jgi:hypothetical protein
MKRISPNILREHAVVVANSCKDGPAIARDMRLAADVLHELQTIINKLRLERDVLALNFGGKDNRVMIVMGDDGNVARVAWPNNQAATERLVVMPSYYTLGAAEAAKEISTMATRLEVSAAELFDETSRKAKEK